MARTARPNIPGGVYHVMARGNERKDIYFDDADREQFLELLEAIARRCQWDCLAYCLMRNHYHLVVRTPLPNLSRGMRLVNGEYANSLNRRYGRVGHLFQGRFRSVLIRDSAHLLLVIKYVLRNPVTAGLCAGPGDWRWSSYRATLEGDSTGLVVSEATLAWFGAKQSAREHFALFISEDDARALETTLGPSVEFPSVPRDFGEPRPSIEELLAVHPGAAGIAIAYHDYGYSLAQIGAVLGCSRPTVGRRLVAHESEQMLASGT